MTTTPKSISPEIRRLCEKIGGLDEPVYLQVSPRSDSGIKDCFIDVQNQVSEHGGSIQHGWVLWEWAGIYVEGEFHAVWRKPDGQMLDVQEKPDGEQRILFAPDSRRVFEGVRVDNIRMAVGRDPRIKEWIAIVEKFDKIVSRDAQNVPFGSLVTLSTEAENLQLRSTAMEKALARSRDARRAAG